MRAPSRMDLGLVHPVGVSRDLGIRNLFSPQSPLVVLHGMEPANDSGLVNAASTSRDRVRGSMRKVGRQKVWTLSLKERMRAVLLGLLNPDPQAAKAATLTLHLRHRDAPDH